MVGVKKFQYDIRFTCEFDEARRARLLQIAERGPIHRTLSGSITISTELLTGTGPDPVFRQFIGMLQVDADRSHRPHCP